VSAVSVLRYSPAFFAFIVVIADAGRWADPDLWGHITFGRLILSLGHVPSRDIYSYSAFGHPWHDPEWLAEMMLALSYSVLGVVGLKLMKFACTAATVLMIAFAEAETGASIMIQLVVLMVAGVALIPMMQFRPQLFTYMLLAALMALLARDTFNARGARFWPVIPIFALWANTHGGVAAGLAALGLYAGIRGLEDLLSGRGLGRGIRLGGWTLAAGVATLANPYGLGNWLAVAKAIRNPVTRAVISEWQPLFFKMAQLWHQSPSSMLAFAPIIALPVALTICFLYRPRGGDLALVAIAAMMTFGAYLSVRNMALAVIAAVVPLCHHASLALGETRFGRPEPLERRTRGNEILLGAIAVILAVQTGLFSNRLAASFALPNGAVDFMQAHDLSGNVLCDFGWGDYLIWRMAPKTKVFIDARYDFVYPMKVIYDYFDFYLNHRRAQKVLSSYPHDFILIPPDAPVRELMEHSAGWKLIYSDPNAMLFARANSRAARIPGVPIRGRRLPAYFP
jgi:hypothetical protein